MTLTDPVDEAEVIEILNSYFQQTLRIDWALDIPACAADIVELFKKRARERLLS